jgi:hypothetical protein
MSKARGPGEVDGARQLRDEWKHLVEGRGCVVAQGDVEGFSRDVLFRPERDRAFNTCGDWFNDRRMEETGVCRLRQFARERLRLFGRNVEAKDLDGDEAIARGLVRSENGPKCTNTDLMEDPEGTERRRWGERGRIVSGQGPCSSPAATQTAVGPGVGI